MWVYSCGAWEQSRRITHVLQETGHGRHASQDHHSLCALHTWLVGGIRPCKAPLLQGPHKLNFGQESSAAWHSAFPEEAFALNHLQAGCSQIETTLNTL